MQSRIRDVRRAKGLTLADVAERCTPPTTAQTIGRLETGMRVLSLIWINRIADALGVDSSDLVALPAQMRRPVHPRAAKDHFAVALHLLPCRSSLWRLSDACLDHLT